VLGCACSDVHQSVQHRPLLISALHAFADGEGPGARAQVERGAAAAGVLETLEGLWDALDVAEDDIDRQIFLRLLSGPAHLHTQSLAKVPPASAAAQASVRGGWRAARRRAH